MELKAFALVAVEKFDIPIACVNDIQKNDISFSLWAIVESREEAIKIKKANKFKTKIVKIKIII